MIPFARRLLIVFSFTALAAGNANGRADADGIHTVRGRIAQVRPLDKTLTVHSSKGEDITLNVDEHSRLEIQRQPAKLGDFQEGMRVRITYDTEHGKNRVLTLSQPRVTLENLQKEVGTALESAKSYTYQQKEEYQKKLSGVLQDLDEHMDDLKAKAGQASDEAKKRYAKEIDELGKKREVLHKKLAQVRAAAPGAWEDIKSGVGAAAHDLQHALERVRARLQEKPPANDKEPR